MAVRRVPGAGRGRWSGIVKSASIGSMSRFGKSRFSSALFADTAPAEISTGMYPAGSHRADRTLADNYEYVMHGRVFDVSYGKDGVVEIAISFGGLLCRLTGDQRHLSSILPDMRLYLLVKKD